MKKRRRNYRNICTSEFLKWTLLSLILDTAIFANRGLNLKSITAWQIHTNLIRRLNMNLHCLQRCLYRSAGNERVKPEHGIYYKIACGLSRDLDQPAHLYSLIRFFAGHAVGSQGQCVFEVYCEEPDIG